MNNVWLNQQLNDLGTQELMIEAHKHRLTHPTDVIGQSSGASKRVAARLRFQMMLNRSDVEQAQNAAINQDMIQTREIPVMNIG
ncbi:MAG TPA: hypothetical protein VHL11_01580 [Phototrophicaceae bacterium]|jgi:hypothetical protein|nr:hypothetical protein [Phototrophicaceae bacterium]